MVKIISRQSLGRQNVYDIGVETDHNFILANGLVASNCFNKSHSTAYAYVTYQTAYLKANYPVEYMAALLTASSNNTDKVEKYIDTCRRMKIDVEPPDINRSQVDFTPDNEKILFGLSAVRNLGLGAIENILKAREEAGGKFASLADLCARVDLHTVSRRALESLIYCGAFDQLMSNRNQLLHDLEPILSWAQSRAKDRASGQTNLFDNAGNEGSEINHKDAPKASPVEDLTASEKLKREKELLGFYVSDHPLKSAQNANQFLSPIVLGDKETIPKKRTVSAIVLVSEIKKIITKNNDPMAFVQLEDISGQIEGVIFPSSYERISPYLEEDARLIVWGKIDEKEDRLQMIIDDAEPVEQVKMVIVDFDVQQVRDRANQEKLQKLLKANAAKKNEAKTPVIGRVKMGGQQQLVRFGEQYWVKDPSTVTEQLQEEGFAVKAQSLI
ncbi:trans-splicing intein-formed DNA polymerase III subunit alpha C-terminal partner DnaE-C [Euhalothece natronophila Z-M001]|uniref:Trans-splicing intein-formed DNA polymerase III subunit alpha C-terminal partner DnaE-C n=1 Tax=Euhalothece natronophila Z-M001 TaxID=522448 RepID=A0A5B8NS32_9CHRO|nr:OB-fold nucleic acid binding domain-containing protein [Euhalothece natronophila]QDZ41119.1 trans-splicing intein-formed DNA polymerase III subunit alpha C-terminal partner DnaE-C [Euhalothece natronophila Z-M001]